MNTPERTEVRAERRTCSFTGVAVDLTLAVTIIIPCPLMNAVAEYVFPGVITGYYTHLEYIKLAP